MQQSFYLGLANELAAKVGRINAFVRHGPSIGAYHEEVLRAVLRNMLPDRFSLRTGFVFNPTKGASQQGDIPVVDEHHPDAYYFREGNFAIVSGKGIACVIEVKTKLNGATFKDSLTNLASFQSVLEPADRPLTLVFAFNSSSLSPSTLDRWYKNVELQDKIENYPASILSLNRGMIILRPKDQENWGHHVVTGENDRGPKLKCLSLFLQTVRKATQLKAKTDGNPFELASLDGLASSLQRFRYKKGLINGAAA